MTKIHLKAATEFFVIQSVSYQFLTLNHGTINTVFTICELNDIVGRVPYSSVIADSHIFQGLNESALNITCFCGLHSSVDKTLATSHCVEEKFMGRQATKI